LPYHAKLKHYLKTWHIRLEVFREVPSYLSGLTFLQEILREAWQGLRHVATPEIDLQEINALEERLTTAQFALKRNVSELGTQLDRMLDILEGQDDCLPDIWIDKYENNEKSYGEWSYEADRRLFQLRHLELQPSKVSIPESAAAKESDTSTAVIVQPASGKAEADTSPTGVELSFAGVEASTPPALPKVEEQNAADEAKSESFQPPNGNDDEIADENEISDHEEAVIAEAVHRPVEAVLRRASVASIESFTRDQVFCVWA
jgi:hypothetical protein